VIPVLVNKITKSTDPVPYLENQIKEQFHIFQVKKKSINNLKSTLRSQTPNRKTLLTGRNQID
jgi:hypothetical protein